MRLLYVIAATLPLTLAGCAGMPPSAGNVPSQAHYAARPYHDKIDITGRLSVRYQGERNEESLHGSFNWTQSSQRTGITLLSPVGQTVAVIDVTAEGASLTRAGQPARSAPDVDSLTSDTLGWPLPVAGLRDWLQGFGLDATGQRFVATPSAPEVTTSDGWRIRYANWLDENPATPDNRAKRIDLARWTAQAGNVSIRIVIDSWQPH